MSAVYPDDNPDPDDRHRDGDERNIIDRIIDQILN